MPGDLTKNLSRWEFQCPCCDKDTVDYELVTVLQELVDDVEDLGKPYGVISARIIINSGNRCLKHNYDVGGADDSMHLKGKASDFTIEIAKHPGSWEELSPLNVYLHLNKKYPHKYGIGNYKDFTHLDVREKKARWHNN